MSGYVSAECGKIIVVFYVLIRIVCVYITHPPPPVQMVFSSTAAAKFKAKAEKTRAFRALLMLGALEMAFVVFAVLGALLGVLFAVLVAVVCGVFWVLKAAFVVFIAFAMLGVLLGIVFAVLGILPATAL